MGQDFLVTEQIDAGDRFIRDFNEYASISVACWVKPEDAFKPYLYLASDEIDDTNIDLGYGEVLRRLRGKASQWLDPFQVKLVNTGDPVARDAIAIRDRYPAKLPTRYYGSSIGGIPIEGAYIYAFLSPVKTAP